MPEKSPSILVAALGGHQVTMTNPMIGTVQVSNRGFYTFRGLVTKRGIIDKNDTQSEVLCELGACFEAAKRLRSRDRDGNLLLLDEDTSIMFVVHAKDRVLLSIFEPKNGPRRKRDRAKKAAAVG